MSKIKTTKPLGGKAYGSIGHLPASRMGPGDHAITEGQSKICTVKPRDKHDVIVVQEKLDGSCVSVAKINGDLHALGRAGWPAASSKYIQHRMFHDWVLANWDRFNDLLKDGERVCGEWLAQAHGTRYALKHEPFVAFDIFTGFKRIPFNVFQSRCVGVFEMPHLIHCGSASLSIADAMAALGEHGHHGAVDRIEGAVWRVERKGKWDFLAKYVRSDKVDGVYLPELSGGEPVWNWMLEAEGKR